MEGGDFTGETRVPLVEEKCQYQGKGTGGLAIQYVVPLASGKSLEDFVRKAESEAPPQTCTQNHNLHFNLRSYFFIPHLRLCLLILERGRKGEREREKNICMQNINWLPPYIP